MVYGLLTVRPQQALRTGQILEQTGREDVCSVCGDEPAADFLIPADSSLPYAVMRIRLCRDCKVIRRQQGEFLERI
jgi:hypothetical protein